MHKLPIHEKFLAFQGEGDHMGIKAFFIRTFGCPLACPWCDSAGTWHKEYVPKNIERIDVKDLAEEAASHRPNFVVITGGEPTIHKGNLTMLVVELKKLGVRVHLETSGAFNVEKYLFNWITLSPKDSKRPTDEMLRMANEYKIIVEDEHSISKWIDVIDAAVGIDKKNRSLWLHPEWSRRNDPTVLNSISNFIKTTVHPIWKTHSRAGYQLHKLYKVDALDPGAKGLAPLGGNPELGF
jgi:7-carboxy-7-deazaguanine synthase